MNPIARPATPMHSDARIASRDVRNDRAFRWIVGSAGVFVLVSLVARRLLDVLGRPRWPSRPSAWSSCGPTSGIRSSQQFGALVPIYGTLVTACIAMLIAVPVSFGIAMFLTEVAPTWMRGTGRRGDRTARRHSLDHLRHVGPVRARAGAGRARVSVGRRAHGHAGRSSAAFRRPAARPRHAAPRAWCSRSWSSPSSPR